MKKLIIYHSKVDIYGNQYHAFTYTSPEGGEVNATNSGDNAGGIPRHATGYSSDTYKQWVVFENTLPIRQFNRMTKGWAHAGCTPEELWAFIQKETK